MRLYYRLGTAADQEPLEEFSGAYHGVAVGANIAVWGKTWVSSFLTRTSKPYFVDPVTYRFALDPKLVLKEEQLRRSFDELARAYGGPIREAAGRRPLRGTDFLRGTEIRQTVSDRLVESVLKFEESALGPSDPAQQSLTRYMRILGKAPGQLTGEPEFLIPPYFYVISPDNPWYEISLWMARRARRLRPNKRVIPVICLSDDVLDSDAHVSKIAKDFGAFEGVLVWISGLDEHRAPSELLGHYAALVRKLAKNTKPMILYGGFFAVALSVYGVQGISSGVCYSESKAVDSRPTGGGFPTRYYLPFARTKVVVAEALRFFSSRPEAFCDCAVCEAGLLSHRRSVDSVQTALSAMNRAATGKHFMLTRAKEVEDIGPLSAGSLVAKLEAAKQQAERWRAPTFGIPIDFLDAWMEALRQAPARST